MAADTDDDVVMAESDQALADNEPEDLDRHDRHIASLKPKAIQRLEESVVNKIAAGEIIQRPSNALKELVENSLDAGATMIKVSLKEGGIKMLQIQDNGHGIRHEDLPLLCERFATSKLREFDDLSKMTTFGFRGEALASVSYITAGLNVVTKTKDSDVGYKAFYSEGRMVPAKPGQSAAPKVCAAVDGTTITAEELFYNAPQRRRALGSASEEYNRCLDVIGRYAVHFGGRGVGFVCRRDNNSITDLSTSSSPTNTTHDTIKLLHGQAVARELRRLKPHRSSSLGFSVEGWISGANWSAKKLTMLCFINHRLVECPSLRKAVEALYATLLPKGGHPWIYISLEIAPERVDVNVHPTKREVHFLEEDDIVDEICTHMQSCLVGANQSRTFQFSQILLPGATQPDPAKHRSGANGSLTQQKGYPRHSVRTDSDAQTLDAHVVRRNTAPEPTQGDAGADTQADEELLPSTSRPTLRQDSSRSNKIKQSKCSLQSVNELRAEILEEVHSEFAEILQNHTFVGVVDLVKGLSLIQHQTKLYLVNHALVIEEFAYQLIIRQFGTLEAITLEPSIKLKELVLAGIDADPDFARSGLDPESTSERICLLIMDKAEMLQEYYAITIDEQTEELTTLPSLLPRQFSFPTENIPRLFARLGPQINWQDEKECLEGVARELAYACMPVVPSDATPAEEEEQKWIIEHAWFANTNSKRGTYRPSKAIQRKAIFQVAAMSDLYRVFERC